MTKFTITLWKQIPDAQTIDDINALIYRNAAIDPSDQNEQNMKLINDIYLRNFSAGYYDLYDDDLTSLLAVAQQCYVTGGPSVFEARSMYWIATGTSDLAFQDDCISTTGEFRTINPLPSKAFKIYPNPVSGQGYINIESSKQGTIIFSNLMGQVINSVPISDGTNSIQIGVSDNIVFYELRFADGSVKNGKIVILK